MRPPNVKADLTAWAHKHGAVVNVEFMGTVTWSGELRCLHVGFGIELSSECIASLLCAQRRAAVRQSTKHDFVE